MNSLVALVVLVSVAAVLVWTRPASSRHSRRRLQQIAVACAAPEDSREPAVVAGSRLPFLATLLGAIGVFAVLGGWLGFVAAIAVGAWLPRWLARLEPGEHRRRREARALELPLVVDLLAACLSAGGSPEPALRAVACASSTSVSDDLGAASLALRTGATPAEAFAGLPDDLAVLARVFDRSHRTGASVAYLLTTAAEQLRADARASQLDAARRLGVTTAAPLGLCFLPGFVVLGLIPVIIGLVQSLL